MKEVTGVPGITVKHSTTKHAQTIGMLESSHRSAKKALKTGTGERIPLWDKHVSIAVFNYNTSHHTIIGCEPRRVFNGRIRYNVSDIQLVVRPQKAPISTSQFSQDVSDQSEMIYLDVRKNAIQAYIKYKPYYAKNANASKLKEAHYVFVLQPKADYQGTNILFTENRSIGPKFIQKKLPNSQNLVCKVGTNKTQVLHRLQLRPFAAGQPLPDVQFTLQERKSDPEVSLKHDDLYARP